ncbi:MAG: class I SAM-dependent methyltransferase [Sciscionella sp.]
MPAADVIVPSPNIWHHPAVYEIENRAQDVHGVIWRTLREHCDWASRDVLDVGCGNGFHLPVFAATARSVVGVEPYRRLVRGARERVSWLDNVRVVSGVAGRLRLPDGSADLVHARTAYFFGRGCQPGLAEADRVLRPGGTLAIVDLDGAAPPYGEWLRADLPRYDSDDVLAFFSEQGFACYSAATLWRFDDRASLEAVLRIEFSPKVAERAIAQTPGLTIPVGYRVHIRRKPPGLLTH